MKLHQIASSVFEFLLVWLRKYLVAILSHLGDTPYRFDKCSIYSTLSDILQVFQICFFLKSLFRNNTISWVLQQDSFENLQVKLMAKSHQT